MSLFGILLAVSVSVAFPRPGQNLPSVTRVYAIGAVSPDVTNLVVGGQSVVPYRTGAWAAVLPVVEDSNTLTVVASGPAGAVTNAFVFSVAPRVKKYTKLSYAKDGPREDASVAKTSAETLIYLDPGHGGADTGAISPHGRTEKEANLALALATAEHLRALGYRVKLTRADDRALELYDRARGAHDDGADAFVSIHHNAPAVDGDPMTRYSAVYAWNELGDSLALAIADRLAKTHTGVFPSKGILRANFAVTRSPEIPSCLVEADFITSPMGEEDSFASDVCSARANAIAAGIDEWCRTRARR